MGHTHYLVVIPESAVDNDRWGPPRPGEVTVNQAVNAVIQDTPPFSVILDYWVVEDSGGYLPPTGRAHLRDLDLAKLPLSTFGIPGMGLVSFWDPSEALAPYRDTHDLVVVDTHH